MVRVEVVRDIAILTRPRLERLELALRLRHVRVEVVEVAELRSAEAGVGVGRVEPLVVLDVDEDIVFLGGFEEVLVVLEELDGGLGDEDVVAAFDGVEGDGVVGCVGGEDGDGAALGEGVDGVLVGVRVALAFLGVFLEGDVEAVVGLGDVFFEMLAWRRKVSTEVLSQ